jgi:hypothetical protein
LVGGVVQMEVDNNRLLSTGGKGDFRSSDARFYSNGKLLPILLRSNSFLSLMLRNWMLALMVLLASANLSKGELLRETEETDGTRYGSSSLAFLWYCITVSGTATKSKVYQVVLTKQTVLPWYSNQDIRRPTLGS